MASFPGEAAAAAGSVCQGHAISAAGGGRGTGHTRDGRPPGPAKCAPGDDGRHVAAANQPNRGGGGGDEGAEG